MLSDCPPNKDTIEMNEYKTQYGYETILTSSRGHGGKTSGKSEIFLLLRSRVGLDKTEADFRRSNIIECPSTSKQAVVMLFIDTRVYQIQVSIVTGSHVVSNYTYKVKYFRPVQVVVQYKL